MSDERRTKLEPEVITNLWRVQHLWFAPNGHGPAVRDIQTKAKELCTAIIANSPTCADQTAALRKVREAVATAEMAVNCGGR